MRIFVMFTLFLIFSASLLSPVSAKDLPEMAPGFTLEKAGGGVVTLEKYRGSAVIVNFWATWCKPCVEEMPALERIHRNRAGSGVSVIGVNYRQKAKRVERFIKENSITFPVALDSKGKTAKIYGVNALPHTVLVDKDGKVVKSREGPLTESTIDEWFQALKTCGDSPC